MPGRIVLLGGPGAGKGTQAASIVKREQIPHISTGDIFREHIQGETELGKQIKDYLSEGRLVPDGLTCRVIAERIAGDDCEEGYVLDGFPRTIEQAETLDRLLGERGEQLDVAIELHVEDEEIVGRLTARRTCPECGHIYNLSFSPPAKDNECDDCPGVQLTQRADDKEETIRERLNVYHDQTEPILAYYEDKGLLRVVESGGKSPGEIAETVEEIVSAKEAV